MAKESRRVNELALKLDWTGLENLPISFVNQFAVQHDARTNEFYLSVGAVSPPLIMGSDADRTATAAKLKERGTIPVHPVARLGLTPERVLELIKALQTNYRTYQEVQARSQSDADPGGE